MTTEEEVYAMIANYKAKHGYAPDIIEYDGNGNVIGCGSHEDYDYFAVQVQNGDGYYNECGRYTPFASYDEY